MNDTLSDIYDKISSLLKSKEYDVSEKKEIDYGIQFIIFKNNNKGIIRIYKKKNGSISIDFSQIKSGILSEEIMDSILNLINDPSKPSQDSLDFGFPIIGTDESGKGDFFGPLVCAGVYVNELTAKQLSSVGVKDSKELSDEKIDVIANKIKDICRGSYSIIEISPKTYNKLYDQFKIEKQSLNNLLAWGHAKAIEELLGKVNCNKAIVDKFANERFIIRKLQEKGRTIKIIQRHKGERNIAVAAASILARARFIEKLSNLSEKYDMSFPKGASQKVIGYGKLLVDVYGQVELREVAKVHFKTTSNILN